jgi:hypothetical protein
LIVAGTSSMTATAAATDVMKSFIAGNSYLGEGTKIGVLTPKLEG